MKKWILHSLAALSIVLSAISGSLAIFGRSFEVVFFGMEAIWWTVFGMLFIFIGVAAIYFSFSEEKKSPPPPTFPEFEKFMKECKLSIRGHLKLSILFWVLAYRKEKAKSFEDAKKEVFQEIKKEIPHVRWMDAILSEIHEDLSKIKY